MPDPLDASTLLLGGAAALAVVHALIGVDHSLPFVALGRARRWTLRRTLLVTAACGAGHVASSVLIGAAGVGLGLAIDALLRVEAARGELAAALLIGFGLAYAARAVWRHRRAAGRLHAASPDGAPVTPRALFIVFLVGPCEPLIPLMAVPGAARDWPAVAAVVGVFGLLTIAVMLAAVAAGHHAARFFTERLRGRIGPQWFDAFRRHADVAAGLVVAASGAAVLVLGL